MSESSVAHDHRWIWLSATAVSYPRCIIYRWRCNCGVRKVVRDV